MKQLFCLFLGAVMLSAIFSGCAPADAAALPETQATTAASETATPGALTNYQTPARFTGDWTGLEDTYIVHADAEILLPKTDGMPKAKIQPRSFTQEEADRMRSVFLQDNPFYQEPVPTKQYLQEELAHYEAIARGEIPYEHDGTIDRVPEIIERLKEQIKTAPNEGERFPAETTFHKNARHPEETASTYDPDRITGYAEVDGKTIHCFIHNDDEPFTTFATFWEEGYGNTLGPDCSRDASRDFTYDPTTVTPSFSEEQAREIGDALIKDLDMDTFVLDYIVPVNFEDNGQPTGETGYDLMYVRTVKGLPLTHTSEDGGASEENTPDIGSWSDEHVRVLVAENRVVWFRWSSPYGEPEILEENVSLVPFSEIQEVFGEMIFVKNSYWQEANRINGFDCIHEVNIDKVQLTLMRTRPRDSISEGTIIPVWDFWGSSSAHTEDEAYKDLVYTGSYYEVQMTINAMDGTVVDREIGY